MVVGAVRELPLRSAQELTTPPDAFLQVGNGKENSTPFIPPAGNPQAFPAAMEMHVLGYQGGELRRGESAHQRGRRHIDAKGRGLRQRGSASDRKQKADC